MIIHLLLTLASALPALTQLPAAAGPYTPTIAPCPSNFTLVRLANATTTAPRLHPSELAYTAARRSAALPDAWKSYLANVEATSAALPPYVAAILSDAAAAPALALALSGGSYRAAAFGAGALNALDGRNASAAAAGTGGLLQAATYVSALSGGSWTLMSLLQANFPTIGELVFGSGAAGAYAGWLSEFDVLAPSADAGVVRAYVGGLLGEIVGKHARGFGVGIADVWARALARHFLNGTTAGDFFSENVTHGAGITYSALREMPVFVEQAMPFPIMTSLVYSDNDNKSNILPGQFVSLGSPILEFTVYEMGSYDPVLAAFTPMEYLGTQNTTSCVSGFDQAAFITGTSSELFNEFNTSMAALLNSAAGPVIEALNAAIPQPGVEIDVSLYPNPFFGIAPETFIATNEQTLKVVDGGEDGQVMPLQPLLVKDRAIDVIIAIDATNDVDNFANGSALIASARRAALFPDTYPFPPTPSTVAEIASQNLTRHPTFFGCGTAPGTPLLIYIANGGPPRNGDAPVTNVSTNQLGFQAAELQGVLDQTFDIMLQGLPADGDASVDEEWPACLACAVVDRARNRSGVGRSGVCESCFGRYCWGGSTGCE